MARLRKIEVADVLSLLAEARAARGTLDEPTLQILTETLNGIQRTAHALGPSPFIPEIKALRKASADLLKHAETLRFYLIEQVSEYEYSQANYETFRRLLLTLHKALNHADTDELLRNLAKGRDWHGTSARIYRAYYYAFKGGTMNRKGPAVRFVQVVLEHIQVGRKTAAAIEQGLKRSGNFGPGWIDRELELPF